MLDDKDELLQDEYIVETARITYAALIPHILLMFIGIGFITMISVLLRMLTTKLLITNKRILGKNGVFATFEMDAPITKINSVSVSQSVFGRIFNYGRLRIMTSNGVYNYKRIAHPYKIKYSLWTELDKLEHQKA